jgi:long-chain acyl-CoA synthetase
MNVALWLERAGKAAPHRPAIGYGRRVVRTYAELAARAARLAAAMRGKLGLTPGERVAVIAKNCPEYVEILYGLWWAGLAAVPANAKLHGAELGYVLEHSGAKLCFATPELESDLAAHAPPTLERLIVIGSPAYAALLNDDPIAAPIERRPDDLAWLFYTSGTTGRPKGAVLTFRNLIFMASCYYADIDQLDERDVKLHAAPLSHATGLYSIPHTAKGSHHIILSGSFEPDRIFDVLEKHPSVTMFGAPTMVTRLINHRRAGPESTRGLRTLYFGGAPMYVADLKKALELFGPKLTQIYGQGETPNTISLVSKRVLGQADHPRREEILACCGTPRTGVQMQVVDPQGRQLPPGEVGEVITRSDCVMRGYWNNPEANAKSLRDGWLWTGDLGFVDAEGFLTLKDRSKDMIISGGSNIYPREIEEVLLKHPAVLECAVIGREHAEWGEEVVAFVAARPGADVTAQDLDQLCLNSIARYKRPRVYRLIETLPKSSYGKILKTELRQLLKETGDA